MAVELLMIYRIEKNEHHASFFFFDIKNKQIRGNKTFTDRK